MLHRTGFFEMFRVRYAAFFIHKYSPKYISVVIPGFKRSQNNPNRRSGWLRNAGVEFQFFYPEATTPRDKARSVTGSGIIFAGSVGVTDYFSERAGSAESNAPKYTRELIGKEARRAMLRATSRSWSGILIKINQRIEWSHLNRHLAAGTKYFKTSKISRQMTDWNVHLETILAVKIE